MRVSILYNDVSTASSQDDLDVLAQVNFVSEALRKLGHATSSIPVTLDLQTAANSIKRTNPDLVFNLVESISGVEKFIHFAPTLLEHLKIPYTGGSAHALYLTTNKLFAKEVMHSANLPTPSWLTRDSIASGQFNLNPPCIIKPVCDDASVGIDENSIVYNIQQLEETLKNRSARFGECFAEAYIPGREFNLSILANSGSPEVLPAAEIRFLDFPESKPRIVGYQAKWDENSFEYKNTIRSFQFTANDQPLLKRLSEMALRCWEVFKLRGYARVDFRVDSQNNIWILEINANPCISPDSGFVAATRQAALTFEQVVARILADPNNIQSI